MNRCLKTGALALLLLMSAGCAVSVPVKPSTFFMLGQSQPLQHPPEPHGSSINPEPAVAPTIYRSEGFHAPMAGQLMDMLPATASGGTPLLRLPEA